MTIKASTCCGKGNTECACGKHQSDSQSNRPLTALLLAQQATCSCGKQSALHCTCAKAGSENKVAGPRCSCRARPAGECTCDRSDAENTTPTGSTCQCGSRPAGKLPSAWRNPQTCAHTDLTVSRRLHVRKGQRWRLQSRQRGRLYDEKIETTRVRLGRA